MIFQNIKPHVFTQTGFDSGVENMRIKMPVQHKNSEAVLLPMLGMQFNSPQLRGLMEAMDKHDIDVIQFESAVKVGLQGVIDLNGLNSRSDIVNKIGEFKTNPNVFHTISYEDYKIQQPVTEHLQDSEQGFGTQIRKLIQADIDPDAKFNIGGKPLSKKELIDLYNNTIIENTIQAYDRLKAEFADPNQLQKLIEEELFKNDRYSRDLIYACQTDANGNFVLPLLEPAQSMRVQQLLNSI